MNKVIWLLIFLLLISQASIAQDILKEVNVRWANFKTDLKHKTDVVVFITDSLLKSKQVHPKEVKQAKTMATRLFEYIDTLKQLNHSSILTAHSLNSRLSQALSRLRTILERNDKVKTSTQYFNLLVPLDAIENRLNTSRMDFNDACADANHPDLYFGNYTKHSTAGLDTVSRRTYNN